MSHPSELQGTGALRQPDTSRTADIPPSAALMRFCDALDAACDDAGTADPSLSGRFATRVREALLTAAADSTLLTPAQREGSPERYCRHLLAADPLGRYALVSLVWQPGQESPVHAHHTWCGYAVVEGLLTESLYDWSAQQYCATEARTLTRSAGAVSYVRAGMTGIHRLANRGNATAVSLHLYGVPAQSIATHVNDNLVSVASPFARARYTRTGSVSQ